MLNGPIISLYVCELRFLLVWFDIFCLDFGLILDLDLFVLVDGRLSLIPDFSLCLINTI